MLAEVIYLDWKLNMYTNTTVDLEFQINEGEDQIGDFCDYKNSFSNF